MKRALKISIKQRIYGSFSLLVFVFVVNGVITIGILNNHKKEHAHISAITDPSIEALHNFRKVMRESMMFTTNWVFIRSDKQDKKALVDLQGTVYPSLKAQLLTLSASWYEQHTTDSLKNIFACFEDALQNEKKIMGLLQDDEDYNDLLKKTQAEGLLENIVIPKVTKLSLLLNRIMEVEKFFKAKEEAKLDDESKMLRSIIFILAISTLCMGIFFSIYVGNKIIGPIHQIRGIINDLGKGTLRKINLTASDDEVGKMILSVNNLSEKLQATTTFAHETGLRNFDMPFSPLSNEDALGKALLSMRENLKTGETNLALKNKELERKNKELEQFAFVASHDLQEPLRTASSFVGLLKQQYQAKLDERADRYLCYISQAAGRMQTLITDLLDYSRIGNEKELRQVDCNMVMDEVLADFDPMIIKTEVQISTGDLPVINGYEPEIKQLFQNLIGNSLKFRKKDAPLKIAIAAWEEKGHWQFAFSDNGIGIAKEHFDRIFIIFQRLHVRDKYQGSGIGLSHCKKIVELHKGKIWLESELNQGTTFYFTIPQIMN